MKKIILFLLLLSGFAGYTQTFSVLQDNECVYVLSLNNIPYTGTLDSLLTINSNASRPSYHTTIVIIKEIEKKSGYSVFRFIDNKWEYVWLLPDGTSPRVDISESKRFYFVQDNIRGLFIPTLDSSSGKRIGWAKVTREIWRMFRMPDGTFRW